MGNFVLFEDKNRKLDTVFRMDIYVNKMKKTLTEIFRKIVAKPKDSNPLPMLHAFDEVFDEYCHGGINNSKKIVKALTNAFDKLRKNKIFYKRIDNLANMKSGGKVLMLRQKGIASENEIIVFSLLVLEFSYFGIAAILGITTEAAYNRVYRLKVKLKAKSNEDKDCLSILESISVKKL